MSDKTKKEELEWPMARVRSTFFEFYKRNGHTFWPSSPCVPVDDPTLLFTNAGMNQYKPLFLGTCDPNLEMANLKRAVNTQKCIRAGGKHNDLDDVGKDVYHHTFFEMLGNWSFGDYFKEGAIEFAWKCLTEEFKLDPNRLYATYFAGDEQTPPDDEARNIWLQYLPSNRILPFDAKDNFWEMGATGPCGPCTEIHYDRIGGRDASPMVNADLPDVIEIWNVVFIQYNREADGSLRPLPQQHVDTGMGFERLTSILQNVQSNYDTDIFLPLFDAIREVTGARPYTGQIGKQDPEYIDMAYRVVADHIRTLCFAIADGAMPSNDGRGYVLRRVLRRAVRFGRQNLHAELGFFSKLVPTLIELMADVFPELKEKEVLVTRIIREEEESFSRTIDKGLQKFNDLAEKITDGVFKGEDAHFLYTSMGFPFDLTELMAEERGFKVDVAGFEEKMKEEQEKSAAAHLAKTAGIDGKDMRMVAEQTAYLVAQGVAATEDDSKYVWHQTLEGCTVKALFLGRNETEDKIGFVDTITPESNTIGVILDKTCFYAESGGQIFDIGLLKSANGAVIKVENVQLYGQFVLHIGTVEQGSLSLGDTVTCEVDYIRRQPIASNHTMTHVLNHALRTILIDDESMTVDQKGSLVDEAKLRFDFSWTSGLTKEQLQKVEEHVMERITKKVPVDSYIAPLAAAEQISSLRAVFGEKYPDPVRVVAVSGRTVTDMLANPQDATWNEFSVEFCGGTHLTNSSEAQAFVLLSEEGIAKGVRRIVGVTMDDAKKCIAAADDFAARLEEASKLKEDALEAEVKVLSTELEGLSISAYRKMDFRQKVQELSKEVYAFKKKKIAGMADDIVDKAVELAGITDGNKIILRYDFGTDGKIAKSVAQAFGKKVADKALMLISTDEFEGKIMVVSSSPKGLVDCKKWNAVATEGTGGKGGGKPDFAQTQIVGLEPLEQVLKQAQTY